MKAIIMAGGEGSRLRPLTCDCPKPMLPLMGVPLMEYAVRLLKQHEIIDIAATLGYLPECITDYFGDGSRMGVNLRFYTEKTPLGTAGSVLQARSFLDERFIVLSGDGITDFDLSAAVRFHREKGALATLLLKRSANPQEYGMVVAEADGRIRSFHEKPGRSDIYSDWINTGVYILEPEVLSHIPDGTPYDFGHDLFPALLKAHLPVYGYTAEGYWCDVGDVSAYLRVHCDALDGKIRLPGLQDAAVDISTFPGCEIRNPVYIAPDASIDPGAHIGPYSIIGKGCRVERGAGIKRSLLLEGAGIESGAQLRGCIAGRNCTVGENARLFEESVVGSGSRIGSRAMLPPGVKIWPGKCISDGEHPDGNIVWGSRMEQRFASGAMVISSPAETTRCVQACLAQMQVRDVVIGRCGSSVADALWHAAVSGAMAQGLQVVDAGICCLPQLRHTLHALHAGAALLVMHDRLLPLDSLGCILSEKQQRSILKLLERQDYARAFSRDTPPMIGLGDTRSAYVADVAAAFSGDAAFVPSVVLCAQDELCSVAGDILVRAGIPFRCEAEPGQMHPGSGEIGLRIADGGETAVISDAQGQLSEVQRQLACAWTALQLGQHHLVLPLHFTRAIDALDSTAQYLPGERAIWMRELAGQSRLQFRLQLDALYFLMHFLSRLSVRRLSLDDWRRCMPAVHRSLGTVEIPPSDGGHLLHRLAEERQNAELGGGMRLKSELGWAWLSPDAGRLEIFAEAATMEAAGELCAFYESEIRRLMRDQD